MESGYSLRKHNRLLMAAILEASAAVLVSCIAFDQVFAQRHGSNGAVMAVIASAGAGISIWIVIALSIFAPVMIARKSSQPVNYPRIDHLRIAGKYAPTDASKIGVSPLHLR